MVGPSSSCVRVTTPSTLEAPLSTATAFLAAATTVRGLEAEAARRASDLTVGLTLRDTPRNEEGSGEAEMGTGKRRELVAEEKVIVVCPAIDAVPADG